MSKVLIIGGAGYVGSVLCPFLVSHHYDVTVLDTFWYGNHLPDSVRKIRGDMRDTGKLREALEDQDHVIHLACISNDPSFDLKPDLGRSVNWECFPSVCAEVRDAEVKSFIYASSSSVYGVHGGRVTEETECKPLTDYSRFKLMCEEHLKKCDMGTTEWSIIRPATVCGMSPRLRLDLIVNALTISGLLNREIRVHGGAQFRPNINIQDMARVYLFMLRYCAHGETFNAGGENHTVSVLGDIVSKELDVPVKTLDVVDERSYRIESEKIREVYGFFPVWSIKDAVHSIKDAYDKALLSDPAGSPQYYNLKRMKELFP